MTGLTTRVAVYGTLKKNHVNHRILEAGQAKFVAYRSYTGIMLHLGWYPGVVLAEDVHPDHVCHKFVSSYQVSCELYDCDGPTLQRLDKLEGHPNFYYRTPMLDGKFGEVHIYTMRAVKQLNGVQSIIPGGFWNGEQSTIARVDFGDCTDKPKILGYRGGGSQMIIIPKESKEEVVTPKPLILNHQGGHHNSHYYEEWDDVVEGEVVDSMPDETEIDLTLLDQVKEA